MIRKFRRLKSAFKAILKSIRTRRFRRLQFLLKSLMDRVFRRLHGHLQSSFQFIREETLYRVFVKIFLFKKRNDKKVIFIYGLKNWAIHNVGKQLWGQSKRYSLFCASYINIKKADLDKFDVVIFGHYGLYSPNVYEASKSVIMLHDPCELFPPSLNWKNLPIKEKDLALLKNARSVLTISEELSKKLSEQKIKHKLTPTCPQEHFPTIKQDDIYPQKVSLCSVFNNENPRKNQTLMNSLQYAAKAKLGISLDLKIGTKLWPLKKYIEFFDRHTVYVVSSIQEGGPLPAMEAMRRGLVVVTTRVGQLSELITHGENGYFYETKDEFLSIIKELHGDEQKLQRLRLASLETIDRKRNNDLVRKNAEKVLITLNESRNRCKENVITFPYIANLQTIVALALVILPC